MSGTDGRLTAGATAQVAYESVPLHAPAHDHVVQFYEREEALYETVAAFLAEGLVAGEQAVIIARETHREALRFRLSALNVDLAGAVRSGQLTILDAQETLSAFMVDGAPSAALFQAQVGTLIETLVHARPGVRVRAFGEMVDLLWREGNEQGAILLEELWNELAARHSFALLCAYAMASFYREGHTSGFDAVCRHHGRVIPPQREAAHLDAVIAVQDNALLRQRTHALEAEIGQRVQLEAALREALAERRRAEEALRLDIAKREAVEGELRRARDEAEQANRIKAEFLAVMSHELRTPLNAIMGYQQLLTDGIADPATPAQRRYLERIERSSAHLLRLIDDVLIVARIEAGALKYELQRIEVLDAVRSVTHMVDPQIAQSRLKYETDVDPTLVVYADWEKLHQVLLNLIGNAAKFTPAGGRIRITAEVDPGDSRAMLIHVSDSGIGIPADKQEMIFERFTQLDASHTRQMSGVGLGLSISRDLARGMNGDLVVTSVPEQGSTFTLSLPRTAPPSVKQV